MINKLLRPYLTFSVIAILCYFLYEGILGGFSEGIASLTTNLYKTITGYGIFAIWFIPSYYIACYLFYKTYKYSIWLQIVLSVLWAAFGVLGSMYFDWLRVWVENPIYYDAIYYPTAAVLRGVACTFYLVIGRFLLLGFRQIRGVIYIKILLVAICVICLISSIYLSQFLLGTNFSLLNLGSQPYLIFACGILGTIWVISIFYLLRNVYSFPLLQWVGKKSLVIMGTHMSLLLTIVVPFLLRHIVSAPAYNTLEYYLFGVVCVIIMLIAEIPIIKIFDGPLKCLISKRNQN